MSLTRQDLDRIAHLARLQITDEEAERQVTGLSAIVDFVAALGQVDTRGVAPMAHPLAGQVQRLREDLVTETDQHERYQQNAPQTQAALYVVPRVIE